MTRTEIKQAAKDLIVHGYDSVSNVEDVLIAAVEEIEKLHEALFDVTDGLRWWDIMERACVSEERAKEIHQMAQKGASDE